MLTADTILQNRYRIVRQIGHGGMGAVYEALDERLNNTVALKQFSLGGHQLADRLKAAFEYEAELLAKLRHPALPRVIDHFIDETGQYLVMDFISGKDLVQLLEENNNTPLSVDDVLTWMNKLLDALDYLHSHTPPILHRDIKPDNIRLTESGQIMLLDFGLASGSALTGSEIGTRTSTVAVGYTPDYAPLEQIQGAPSDERTDLYALAATCYLLLTATVPAKSVERGGARLSGAADPLQPPHAINPEVPITVSNALMYALALQPDARPANAALMRDALAGKGVPEQPEPPVIIPPPGGSGHGKTTIDVPSQPGINEYGEVVDKKVVPESENNPVEPAPPTPAPEPLKKPKSMVLPAVGGLVVLAVIGVVIYFVVNGGGGEDIPFPPAGGITPGNAAQLQEAASLEGHDNWVTGVSFAPDGSRLASASLDGTVRLWNVQDNSALPALEGHEDAVNSVAFDPGTGTLLASASDDGTVRLWNVDERTEQHTLEGHEDEVLCVAFAPDGATLASGGVDGTVRLWQVANGTELRTLEGHEDEVTGIAFSPDGTLLVSVSRDKTMRVWQVDGGTEQHANEGDQWLISVGVAHDGTIATGAQDGTIQLWRATDGEVQALQTLDDGNAPVANVTFTPDSQVLAAARFDNRVQLWNVADGALLTSLEGHGDQVFGVAFSPDGVTLASGSADASVRLWRLVE